MTRSHLNSRSDEELVRAARLGHREAFDELVRRFRDTMIAIAQQTIGSREAAEDVVQDAFLQALQALPQLHDPAKISHWLFVITRYRARRIGARERRCEPADAVTLDRLLAHRSDRPLHPDDECMRAYEQSNVRAALSRLPPEYEKILRLYYYEEWPLRRIAAHLSVPLSTVKWRLYHARHLLRRQLTAQLGMEMDADTIGGMGRSHPMGKGSTRAGIRHRRLVRTDRWVHRTEAWLIPDRTAERRLRRRGSGRLGHGVSRLRQGEIVIPREVEGRIAAVGAPRGCDTGRRA